LTSGRRGGKATKESTGRAARDLDRGKAHRRPGARNRNKTSTQGSISNLRQTGANKKETAMGSKTPHLEKVIGHRYNGGRRRRAATGGKSIERTRASLGKVEKGKK